MNDEDDRTSMPEAGEVIESIDHLSEQVRRLVDAIDRVAAAIGSGLTDIAAAIANRA